MTTSNNVQPPGGPYPSAPVPLPPQMYGQPPGQAGQSPQVIIIQAPAPNTVRRNYDSYNGRVSHILGVGRIVIGFLYICMEAAAIDVCLRYSYGSSTS